MRLASPSASHHLHTDLLARLSAEGLSWPGRPQSVSTCVQAGLSPQLSPQWGEPGDHQEAAGTAHLSPTVNHSSPAVWTGV